jgi:hypothetical protein
MLNMEFLLEVWLKEPPPWTSLFAIFLLGYLCFSSLAGELDALIEGNGNIWAFKASISAANLFALLASAILLIGVQSPLVLFVGLSIRELAIAGFRIYFAKKLCDISLSAYFSNILKAIALVVISSTAAFGVFTLLAPHPWLRLFCTTGAYALIAVLGLRFVLNAQEKQFAKNLMYKLSLKFKLKSEA